MRKLVKEISKREAGKSETSVGNIRSVLKHLADLMCEDAIYYNEFVDYANSKIDKKNLERLKQAEKIAKRKVKKK